MVTDNEGRSVWSTVASSRGHLSEFGRCVRLPVDLSSSLQKRHRSSEDSRRGHTHPIWEVLS